MGTLGPNERMWHSQERLDVEVVGSENDLKQHLLINSNKLLIPFANVGRALACLVLTLVRVGTRERLSAMMFAILEDLIRGVISQSRVASHKRLIDHGNNHLLEHAGGHIGQWDGLIALADVYRHGEQLQGGTEGHKGDFTFEHVLDENAALDDFLVGVELFVVGCYEEDHCGEGLRVARNKEQAPRNSTSFIVTLWHTTCLLHFPVHSLC